MATLLPVLPSDVRIFDPTTGAPTIQFQNFLVALNNYVASIAGAPLDATYWTSNSNATLTNETNMGALATGYLKQTTTLGVAVPATVVSIPGGDVAGAALTKTDDTNVTLTLGGTPTTALLQASSITAGWTGQLAIGRGGTGASTLTQHGVVIGNSTSAVNVTSAGTSGQVLTSNGASADPTFQTVPGATRLKSGQGSDTSAGATTVDSIAISGLTNLDTLWIITVLESASQATAQVNLYSTTDSVTLMAVTNSPLAAGSGAVAQTVLAQRQGNANAIQAGTTISGFGAFGQFDAVTTAWTGSWTLGLRHGGVTAGGTFKWMWQVWKMPGQ